MKQYLELLKLVQDKGAAKPDRTGTGTTSIFGHQMRFDLSQGFPLVTTKEVNFRAVVAELLWFLSGSTNVNDLDSKIWSEWADANGDLGPIYGAQWRGWRSDHERGHDQITELIAGIKSEPHSRRHIVSAWNVADLPRMALAPCHIIFQFYVADGKLSCQLYQRSADLFLGVPFNIASYALLTHMVAQQCNLKVGEFIWTGGDCHIYDNHREQVALQLSRKPKSLPVLHLARRPASIFDYKANYLGLIGYEPEPAIKGKVAI